MTCTNSIQSLLGKSLQYFTIFSYFLKKSVALPNSISNFISQKIRKLVQPAANFGPKLDCDRQRYIASMSTFERERYEAAQQGVDRLRYLKRKTLQNNVIYRGPITSINIESDESTKEKMLPTTGASIYPAVNEPSCLTNLLNGEKPPNSSC